MCNIPDEKLLIGMICLNLFKSSSIKNKLNLKYWNLLFILGLAKIIILNYLSYFYKLKLIIFK